MNKTFIFTEVVNCGKIGKIAISSFTRNHPKEKLHVYGTSTDFKWINKHKNLIFHNVDIEFDDFFTLNNKFPFLHKHLFSEHFNRGHWGTANLWARLIDERKEKYIIHFDSDVIFRHEAVSDIFNRFKKGFDLVGPIRNYKHNPNRRDDVRHLKDVVQTVFFGFNRERIGKWPLKTLIKMCRGAYNPLGHSVIDFFDPVMFDIISNGGSVAHLSSRDYGGTNRKGQISRHSSINNYVAFGAKLIHFAGVGSGQNFYNNKAKIIDVPKSYVDFALERYSLYVKLFYNEDCGIEFNQKAYVQLKKVLKN